MDKKSVEDLNVTMMRGQLSPASTIIAVGGGKGGVGKSLVSSGLAIFLAQLGRETILIDLDIGAANLHTYLGTDPTATGVNEFLTNPTMKFEQIIRPTQFTNLKLVSGASEVLGATEIGVEHRSRLMSAIYRQPAEFIILDLSAGTHETTLDFLLMAQHKLIVMTPEPSSIENAYRFMKSCFYRRLRRFEHQMRLTDTINSIMSNPAKHGVRSPADLIRTVDKMNPEAGMRLHQVLHDLNFELILNQSRSMRDLDLGPSVQSVSNKYFGTSNKFIGHLEYDNAVWQSLRKRRHLLIEYPQSRLYAQLMSISRRFLAAKTKSSKAVA